jgi:hypothetical protein
MRRASRIRLSAAALLVILNAGAPARAQDDPEPEAEQPVPRRSQPVMTAEQLDQWIFRGSADAARDRLESRLVRVIDQVDQMYALTPEQRKKLEVAGRGDIKRLFDRVQETKEQLDRTAEDPVRAHSVFLEVQTLQREIQQNYFEEGSLFAKTLKKVLTPGQHARHERDFYRSRVDRFISFLDRPLRLSHDQHRRFVAVVVDETHPLKKYGSFEYDAMMLQASRLPEEKLKPIFDASQWRLLGGRFDRAKSLERILVTEGYLPGGAIDAAQSGVVESRTKSTVVGAKGGRDDLPKR